MIFKVENLGKIKEAEVDLNKDLILLTGQNNTGKTYLAYAIYGFLQANKPHFNLYTEDFGASGVIKKESPVSINLESYIQNFEGLNIGRASKLQFHQIFQADKESFKNTKAEFKNTDEYILQNIYSPAKEDTIKDDKDIKYLKKENSYVLELSRTGKNKLFTESKLNDIINDKFLFDILFPLKSESKVYFFPAERSAINIFERELTINKNDFFNFTLKMQEEYRNEFLNFLQKKINRYPTPIQDNLKTSGDLKFLSNTKSPFEYLADEFEKEILGGKISVSEYGDLRFKPEKTEIAPLEMHLSGSMIKSLAGLSFYLRHLAQKHDCIIIDEPEINLHPDNQRKIARFLGRLINEGFKVIISTHSDYIIKEINNLVMLSKESEPQKELLKKYNYAENELIKPERIEALLFRKSNDNEQITPEKIEVDAQGLSVDTIDEELDKLNNVAENIYFQLFENQ